MTYGAPHSAVAVPRLTSPRTIQTLLSTAAEHGSRVKVGPCAMSAAELLERAKSVARGFVERGIEPGDRVAVMLPNRIEMLEVLFAAGLAGAILVPLNPYLKGEFLAHQVRDSAPKIMVTDIEGALALERASATGPTLTLVDTVQDTSMPHGTAAEYRALAGTERTRLPDVHPLSPLTILYTSGTTGPSKGCIISHRYYSYVGEIFAALFGLKPADVMFTAFPLFHGSGQVAALMSTLEAKASLIVTDRFQASTFIREAGACAATVAWGVGAMGEAILRQPPAATDRTHTLRYCNFTPLRVERLKEFRQRFGVEVSGQMYAQSECMPISMTGIGVEDAPEAGRPNPLLDVAIFDDDDMPVPTGQTGEIVVRPSRSGLIHDGYWNNAEATAQSLRSTWHHTGDLGRVDDDGYLFLVDRKKDMIRRRGENVSSAELETAILAHPAVSEVAVVGLSASMSDEDIKARLVPADGVEIDPAELHEWFVNNLPYFSIPRYLAVLDDLPKTLTGRVQKYQLRSAGTTGCWDLEAMGFVVERERRRASS